MRKDLLTVGAVILGVFGVQAAQELYYTLISPPAYMNEWRAYLDLRAELRPDVTFKLVNAMDIYTNALYRFEASATAGAPRNPAESIHAWIRNEMKDVPTADRGKHYFVLGGSWAKAQGITSVDDTRLQTRIPNVFIQPRRAGNVDLIDDDPENPCSDMFYACLDVKDGQWPWDANGNGKYADAGELGNAQNDFYADVVVARIPVEKNPQANARQVIAAFAEKVRAVESPDFDGAYHFAAAGGQTSATFNLSNGRTMRDEREFYDGGINMFDPRHGGKWIDAEELPRNTMKKTVAPTRPVLEGNPLFVYCWGADHASIDAAVAHYFSHNRDFVEYRDHGSAQDLYCKYINANAYINATGITRMIFSGYSCMTGHIDGDKLSLAEAEIVSLKGGTVASVHNSRFGFGTHNVWIDDDGFSSSLQYYMKDAVLREDMDMGSAWLKARQRYYNRGTASGIGRFVLAEQLLLGDPLIKMSPSVPETTLDASEIAVTKDMGYTTLNVKGGTTIAGNSLFKVMTQLNVTDGDTLRFAANGGVGTRGVHFASGGGTLTVASPSKAYFVQPSGAEEVVLAGSGTTLDFEQAMPQFATLTLCGEGAVRRTGNILRGRTEGQLKSFLPLAVENTEVALGTVDAFKGSGVEPFATVQNGALGITFNPNNGLENCWEYLAGSVELEGGSLFVDRTVTAGFGRPDRPGLTVEVSGDSSVRTLNGGKATLYGTAAFMLADDASLTFDATLLPDAETSGKIEITGGRTIVSDDTSLAGEVTITSGTLVLNQIPLRSVTRLTLAGEAKLVIPMDGGGFYQVLAAKGAVLEVGEQTKIYSTVDETTEASSQATSNGSVFDLSQFIVWDKPTGSDWTPEWNGGKKVYFPETDGEVVVNLPEAMTCAFMAFGNEKGTYRFVGKRLSLGSLVLSENVQFDNEIHVATSVLVSGNEAVFSKVITPSLQIQDGAVVSAANVVNEIKTIRGVRFYPLKTNGGDGKSVALFELQFNTDSDKLPLGRSTFTYSTGAVASLSGQTNLWNGSCAGIEALFGPDNCCFITANSVDDLAKGKVFLQFDFATEQPMIVNYGLAASGNAATNVGKSLTDFRVEVSPDGTSWVSVSEVHGETVPKTGPGEMWYGTVHTAFGISNPPADVYVRKGGALVLSGTVSGTVRLDDGAILKVDPTSALTFAAGSTLVLPEAGVAVIDCSAVELTDSSASQTILSGVALTDAQLAQLALRGKPWMKLVVEDGDLVLRLEKHPPKILFR